MTFDWILQYTTLPELFLATVQGLTEFLPISSSAHLILLGSWIDIQTSLSFLVAAHFGTFIAALLYLWRDLYDLLRALLGTLGARASSDGRKTISLIVVATFPVIIAGYFLASYYNSYAGNMFIIASTTVGFGILLWLSDKMALRVKHIEDLDYVDAVFTGFAQACALVPGVSRSGIAITALRFTGATRPAAVRFSYLCGLPLLFGAMVLEVSTFSLKFDISLAIVAAVSFVTALLSMHALIVLSKRTSFAIFAIYRVALGGVLFWLLLG